MYPTASRSSALSSSSRANLPAKTHSTPTTTAGAISRTRFICSTTSFLAGRDGFADAPLLVLFGKGDGTFLPSFGPVLEKPWVFLSGDVDGDGLDDIVSITYDNNLVAALSLGDGAFVMIPSGFFPGGSPLLRDFDGDGIVDLAGFEPGSPCSSMSVYAGRGDGSFVAPTFNVGKFDRSARSLVAEDIDGDGSVDLAVSLLDRAADPIWEMTIFHGEGDGSFVEERRRILGAFHWATGDFDGDGDLDFLTGDGISNSIQLQRNNRNGTFDSVEVIEFEPGPGIRWVGEGDLNADGTLDGVTLLRTPTQASREWSLVTLLNDGRGRFLSASPQWTLVSNTVAGALGDLDHDGDLDLVLNSGDSEIVTALNRGNGVFGEPMVHKFDEPSGLGAALALLDANGDGNLDAFAAGGFLLGTGDGRLATRAFLWPPHINSRVVGFSDMDGDGISDVLLSCGEGLSVLRGRGAGAYSEEERYAIRGVRPTAFGDFDRDGDLDVASLPTRAGLSVYLNRTGR